MDKFQKYKSLEKDMATHLFGKSLGNIASKDKIASVLFTDKKIPEDGFDPILIEYLLLELALLDSNNSDYVGVGEREGRVYSELVSRRHYRFSHGIGRSGDLGETQPKAIGSSTIANVTNGLILDLFQSTVCENVVAASIIPMATGMTMNLVLSAIRNKFPEKKFVLWSRIDQKSCFKSIIAAGLEPVVLDQKIDFRKNCLVTDMKLIRKVVEKIGAESIACIMTTTSCFAPRQPDKIVKVAQFCQEMGIRHVVNNAYGLQGRLIRQMISRAAKKGRIDALVQSTDKNLMVPVGGAIVATFDKEFMRTIMKTYPGRASASQSLDVFITLLSMGKNGYMELLDEQASNFAYLYEQMREVAHRFDEKLYQSKRNDISIALSLRSLQIHLREKEHSESISMLGAKLFQRGVTGARVVDPLAEVKHIDSHEFIGWGSHSSIMEDAYLTMAASIGMKKREIDVAISKLTECMLSFYGGKFPKRKSAPKD